MTTSTDKVERMAVVAIIGGLLTGTASLVAALFAFFTFNAVGAGVCLASAGLAFGLIANAVCRQ